MMTSGTSELLLASRDARGVVTLTLNDPARFNALGADMLAALQQTLDALVGDEDDTDNYYMRRSALAGGRRTSALSEISIDALMDWCRAGTPQRWLRVTHHCHIVETGNESYRFRHSSKEAKGKIKSREMNRKTETSLEVQAQ